MMILSQKPLTLAEVKELAKGVDEKKQTADYLKKFAKLSKSDAHKLMEEAKALNNIKLKEEDFIKLADFLPQDSEELNKLLSEANLSEEEAAAILNIVKNY